MRCCLATRLIVFVLLASLLLVLAAPIGYAQVSCPPPPDVTCPQNVIPPVVVGSPSGLASTYTIALYTSTNGGPCHLITSSDVRILPQLWLATDSDFCNQGSITFYTDDPTSNSLHCGNDEGCTVDWPYLEVVANPATFHARFGGFGVMAIQMELACVSSCPKIGYDHFTCVEARSTDFDADGDTDELDKIALGQVLASNAPYSAIKQYDLNVDGRVDAADYRLLANEMATEVQLGYADPVKHPALYTCNTNCFGCAPVQINSTFAFVVDTSPPGPTSLTLAGSGNNVTLSWTSPGDDTYNGQQLGVAKAFDLRGSNTPITVDNFSAATALTGVPIPDLPGTSHQMSVAACAMGLNYFAIRTQDWAGNVSALSNVVSVPSPCGVTAVRQVSWGRVKAIYR